MKITLSITPIGWQACDTDSVDGDCGVAHGDYGSGRTKVEALTELRFIYEERLEFPANEKEAAKAARGLAAVDALLAAERRHDELAQFLLDLTRPLKAGWALPQKKSF
jgi:hypothetical protein